MVVLSKTESSVAEMFLVATDIRKIETLDSLLKTDFQNSMKKSILIAPFHSTKAHEEGMYFTAYAIYPDVTHK